MNSFLAKLSRTRHYVRHSSGLHLSAYKFKADYCNVNSNFSKDSAIFTSKRSYRVSQCRLFSSKHSKKNFYQILGVSPKATQAQIKASYYDLSKKHHPDRHKGSQKAHGRFQEISEAYSVLGNLDSRKQYDRSLIIAGVLAPENARPFHKPPKRAGIIYNFDEWTEKHYYSSLLREQQMKRERMHQEKEKIRSPTLPEGSMRLMCVIVMLVIMTAGYLFRDNQSTLDNEELNDYD